MIGTRKGKLNQLTSMAFDILSNGKLFNAETVHTNELIHVSLLTKTEQNTFVIGIDPANSAGDHSAVSTFKLLGDGTLQLLKVVKHDI